LAAVRPNAVLRPAFVLQAAVPQSKAAKQQTTFRNMANGSGEYAFDLPKLNLCTFMADVYRAITTHFPQIQFNERDLFHGHMVPNEASRDVVIIFHAKEIPSDMLLFQTNMWSDVNLLSNITDFNLDSPMMDQRNFIWILSTNTIYLLTDPNRKRPGSENADFAKLILPCNQNKLENKDRKAGTVQEIYFGTEVMSVNYFPNHVTGGDNDHIFFTPHSGGGWGPLLHLESLYPRISPQVIEHHYNATGTSLEQTKLILDKL
jgi:hypothetical protein